MGGTSVREGRCLAQGYRLFYPDPPAMCGLPPSPEKEVAPSRSIVLQKQRRAGASGHAVSYSLFLQALRHVEVVLQRRQSLSGPVLQVGIVAALGVALEQRNRILVRAHLN